MKKMLIIISILVLNLIFSIPSYAIGIKFEETSDSILEDAILIASENGAPLRDVIALGDLDLSLLEFVFDVPAIPATTHWWLIGHEDTNVVYSSPLNLTGIEMYSVEPYDLPGAELAWNIPANLDGYVNETGYSFDWWAQTINNHSSHVAADGAASNLWLFSSPGSYFGSIAVNLHSNDIPGGTPPIPEPSTMILLGTGLVGISGAARRRKKNQAKSFFS